MSAFNVTITSNTTPAIQVNLSNNTTYAQFKNSLGNFVYKTEKVYVYSTLLQQIQGGFGYSKYDSDGRQNLQTVVSAISPYQYQNSLYIDTSNKNLIIDGRDYIRFKMYPNTTLQAKLYCDRIATTDGYDNIGVNNFKELENDMDEFDFFDQYVDII